MTETEQEKRTAAAQVYEEFFVPAIFRQWPSKVVELAGIATGDRVLDVACGTGALTRGVVDAVGAGGSVVGLDLSAGMLAVAEREVPGASWQQGTATSLQFPDESFDKVVSQFGLMFFPDQSLALREMLRVLRPGGVMAVAVWDGLDSMSAYADAVELLDRMAGTAAGDALRAPFSLGDKRRLEALAADAGIAEVSIITETATGEFPSVIAMMEAELRGWLPAVGVNLDEAVNMEILEEAARALSAYEDVQGRMVFPLSAHIIVAKK